MDNLQEDYNTKLSENQEGTLVVSTSNLPSTIDDLSKYVLVADAKLKAVRAAMQLITKVEVAQGVYDQRLKEAQEMAEALLDAKLLLGELMAKVPKATTISGNQYTGKWKNDTVVDNPKSKADVIRDAGFTPKQVQGFQRMAAHPDIVEQAKADAREKGGIVSQAQVLNKIKKISNNPRGWTKEDRESRELTQRILEFTHSDEIPEYTLEMLVEDMKLDADNFFSILRNRITMNAELVNNDQTHMVGKMIDDYIVSGVTEIRRKVS